MFNAYFRNFSFECWWLCVERGKGAKMIFDLRFFHHILSDLGYFKHKILDKIVSLLQGHYELCFYSLKNANGVPFAFYSILLPLSCDF